MAVIGTFLKTTDGYAGTIRTMTIKTKARIVANDKKGNDKAPDFRIFAGSAELGAAWRGKGNSEHKNPFLSVELDDPSLPEPIRAALFENGDEPAALVWSRR